MFEWVMKGIVLTLSLEAVLLVAVFTLWLSSKMQVSLKKVEALDAEKKAWNANRELSENLLEKVETETACLKGLSSQVLH